jgi:hypothetical protein
MSIIKYKQVEISFVHFVYSLVRSLFGFREERMSIEERSVDRVL